MTFEEAATEAHDALRSPLPSVVRKRWLQVARDACAIIALVSFTLGLILVSQYRHEQRATAAQSRCLNSILADHNGTGQADDEANIAQANADAKFARGVLSLLIEPPANTAAQRQASLVAFVAVIRTYTLASEKTAAQLATDAAYRSAHPLGKC